MFLRGGTRRALQDLAECPTLMQSRHLLGSRQRAATCPFSKHLKQRPNRTGLRRNLGGWSGREEEVWGRAKSQEDEDRTWVGLAQGDRTASLKDRWGRTRESRGGGAAAEGRARAKERGPEERGGGRGARSGALPFGEQGGLWSERPILFSE